jgi:hypothetical protein
MRDNEPVGMLQRDLNYDTLTPSLLCPCQAEKKLDLSDRAHQDIVHSRVVNGLVARDDRRILARYKRRRRRS